MTEELKFEIHYPPCPRCGDHNTHGETLGHHGGEFICPSCNKKFIYRAQKAPKLDISIWSHYKKDQYNNIYIIQKDQYYGRRWLLWVNLWGSGFWFSLGGAYWTLWGAKSNVDYFVDITAPRMIDPLPEDGPEIQAYLDKYKIPKEIAEGRWKVNESHEEERLSGWKRLIRPRDRE